MLKKNRNLGAIFVTVFIVFIMVTSVIGYIFGDNSNISRKYKNYKFTVVQDKWRTTIDGKDYHFSFLPQDLESILLPENIFLGKPFQIDVTYNFSSVFNEDIEAARFEFANNLALRNIYVRQGFTTNTTTNLPIITCKDATPTVPVILFLESNETKIGQENYCITVESSDGRSYEALATKLTYKILGVI